MTTQAGGRLEVVCCYTLVGSAVAFSVCRFLALDVPTGVMITPAVAALSALLSRVAIRFESACKARAWATAFIVLFMGLACVVFESALTHAGLVWLNAREAFAPDWALWPASAALSAFNCLAVWAFVRPIPSPTPTARRLPPPELVHPRAADPQTEAILAKVREKMAG